MAEPIIPTPPPTPAPSLVGREREQAALRDALATALAGRGSLVLIGGEAGIGKTALAEALCQKATERGTLVLVGRCYDLSETPPYGPWQEAFSRGSDRTRLPASPDLIGDEVTSRIALVGKVRDYLAALTARRPVVLLLDDLHWADPASLDLLRILGRGLAAMPLLVLATYRNEELTSDHPLLTLLPLLVREARAERLDLRPLDAVAIGALVAARYALGDAERERLARYLIRRTEGNALFLTELLRTLEGGGLLRQEAGGWVVGNLGEAPIPTLLRQVITGRVARLDPETARLLAVAAVIGQVVPLDLWAAVSDTAMHDLIGVAERAIAARLLAETPDGAEVGFAHALIREALYAGLGALRRPAWHRRAAEALLAATVPDPDAVAYHFRRAGDARAGEWLVRAGERAQHTYAWRTAAERFEAALPLLPDSPAAARTRGSLLLRIGLLCRYTDHDRALACFEQAGEMARAAGDARLAAHARFEYGLVRCYKYETVAGLAAIAEAVASLEAAPDDDSARAILRAQGLADTLDAFRACHAMMLTLLGDYAQALPLAEAVAARLPPTVPTGVLDGAFAPGALHALGRVYSALGRPADARRMFRRTVAAYRATGDLAQVGQVAWQELCWTVIPYLTDDLTARRALADEVRVALARARQAGTHGSDPQLADLPIMLLEGRWADLWALGPELRLPENRTWLIIGGAAALGLLARYRGDPALARALVREALPAGAATVRGDARPVEDLPLVRLMVALALDADDLAEARTWLETHDRWLGWSGIVLGQSEGHLAWATYHHAAGDVTRARGRAEQALAGATEPRQPLALLAAHRLLGELAIESRAHDEARTHLDAALGLAETCAAPYERGLTLLALAELHATAGAPEQAAAALAAAWAVLEPLDARPALARANALAERLADAVPLPPSTFPAGLSAREVEVLRLVAQGLSNAEVGAHLFLSPRTVQQHLRSIYNKLGVENRAAATRLAVEHGLV